MFHGRVHYIRVQDGRENVVLRSMYNREWRRVDEYVRGATHAVAAARPRSPERMLEAAERLGAAFTSVRVDFYEISGSRDLAKSRFTQDRGGYRFCRGRSTERSATCGG